MLIPLTTKTHWKYFQLPLPCQCDHWFESVEQQIGAEHNMNIYDVRLGQWVRFDMHWVTCPRETTELQEHKNTVQNCVWNGGLICNKNTRRSTKGAILVGYKNTRILTTECAIYYCRLRLTVVCKRRRLVSGRWLTTSLTSGRCGRFLRYHHCWPVVGGRWYTTYSGRCGRWPRVWPAADLRDLRNPPPRVPSLDPVVGNSKPE